MGKTADQQDTTDRSRSWARSLTWAKTPSASNARNSELPIAEPHRTPGHRNDSSPNELPALSGTTNAHNVAPEAGNSNNGSGSGNEKPTLPSIPDEAYTARPAAAPPPQDTEAKGEKSAAIDCSDPVPSDNKIPLSQRAKAGSKRFWKHTTNALFHSWINLLLIFVPIGIASKAANLNPSVVFAMNAVAIIPLAGLLAHATESVASRLGDTLGALLNVSFGNAVELIIFIALVKNEISIVQASLLGSILANLLLILGMAFAAGGLRYQEQIYNNTVTQMSAVLLSLAVMSLLLPTAFHATFNVTSTADSTTLKISRGTSVVLLLVYLLYLIFQLKSHAYLYRSIPQEQIDEESRPGILADVFDSSTSSSSSSSSSSDTDTSNGSHTTAKKRIKRFIRKRRKSSGSSNDTPSYTTSHVSSPNMDGVPSPSYFDDQGRNSRRPSVGLHDILSGDEGDNEGLHGHVRTHDFGSAVTSTAHSPERRSKKKTKKRKHRKHRKNSALSENNLPPPAIEPIESEPIALADITAPHVGFVGTDSPRVGTPNSRKGAPGLSKTFSRPAMPKLLSQNVFVSPPAAPSVAPAPDTGTGLRRTNSLPDRLNEKARSTPGNRQLPVGRQHPGRPLAPNAARGAWAARVKTDAPPPGDAEGEAPVMSRTAAVVMLLFTTVLVAVCAEFLVDAIPAMTAESGVSQAFIGLIILPIVGNAAEHVTAVAVAYKNKMDLAIGVAVGSSIQIALFVTPIVVLLGWCMDKPMSLYFNLFETVSLFVTVFVVNFLVLDGKSNYLEGVLLMAAYVIIAVAAFFYPSTNQQSALGGSESAGTIVRRAIMFAG